MLIISVCNNQSNTGICYICVHCLNTSGEGSQNPAPAQQPMPGMMQGSNHGQMQGTMHMIQQPGHPQSSYNIGSMQSATSFPNIQYQSQQQQQQSQFQQQNFSQYNNQQMYNQSITPSQTQGHINPMMSPNHTRQYGNQQAGVMHQGQGMSYNYSAGVSSSAGPRLPNPAQQQQQVSMPQMQGWNGNQRVYNMPAQQQQQPQQQQQSYLPQREYTIPNTSNQQVPRMQQFPNSQSQQNSGMYVQQQIGSQAGMVHGVKTSQPSAIGIQQQMYQQRTAMSGAPSFPDATISQANVTSDPIMMQQQQQPAQQFLQQQQPNPQQQFQQQFPYRSPPQQVPQQSKLADNMVNPQQQGMVRFSQSSPAQQNHAQRMPYGNMKAVNALPQRQNVPMLSPRPTPPPVSPSITPTMLSPTGSTSSLQGSFNPMDTSPQKQSMPQPALNSGNNLFPSNAGDVVVADQNKTNFPFNQIMNQMQQPQPMSQGVKPMSSDVGLAVSSTGLSPQGQESPVKIVMSQSPVASPKNVNMEVQNINQQIQQLYGMPQNTNTQQKIHDLQEKLQMLKTMQKSPRPVQTQPTLGQPQQIQTKLSPLQQPLQSNVPQQQLHSQPQQMLIEKPLQANLAQQIPQQQQPVLTNVIQQQSVQPLPVLTVDKQQIHQQAVNQPLSVAVVSTFSDCC